MKKKIENLLNAEHATLKLNPYCTLVRFTKDALLYDVDALQASISILSFAETTVDIESRDWRGIVEEVQAAQTTAFAAAAEKLNKELANGYIR